MTVLMTAWAVSAQMVASPAAGQVSGRVSLVPVQAPPEWRGLDGTAAPSIAWLGDTALVLIDVDEHQVMVARRRDGGISRIGRNGSGPGEFQTPRQVIADPSGRIVVDDVDTKRFTLIGSDLRYLASIPGVEGVHTVLLQLEQARLTIVHAAPLGTPRVSDVDLTSGGIVERFDVFVMDTSVRSMISVGTAQLPNPSLGAVRTTRGEIVVGNPLTYRMTTLKSDGAVVRRFGRPELSIEMETEAEAAKRSGALRKSLAAAQGGPVSGRLLSRLARMAEGPHAKPHFVAPLMADTTGRLWVATTRVKGGMTEIDTFDSEGRFVQTLRVRDRVRALAVRLPLVAILVERLQGDEEGMDGIDLYRVRENRE